MNNNEEINKNVYHELQKEIFLNNNLINNLKSEIKNKDQLIYDLYNSSSWKISYPIRKITSIIKNFINKNKSNPTREFTNDFNEWLNFHKSDKISNETLTLPNNHLVAPLISIVLPTYNPKTEWLIEAIESVRKQTYTNWQLCIADDSSTDTKVVEVLKKYIELDSRIECNFRKQNGHISAASNSALELVKGEWITFLDHDDFLTEDALYWVVDFINKNNKIKLFYSDEAKVNENNFKLDPYFKSNWNRDLFYGHNLICHLAVYQSNLIRKINGFRIGFEGAQDYDLALRYIENITDGEIYHIPKILYYWRIHSNSTAQSSDAKPYAVLAGLKSLNNHFERSNINAISKSGKFGYETFYQIKDTVPSVTIIIKITSESIHNSLFFALSNLIEYTNYSSFKLLIAIDQKINFDELLLSKYKDQIDLFFIQANQNINSSQLLNELVNYAKSDVIVFLDPHVYIKNSNWLSVLVAQAIRPDVGAVGPRICYPDDTVYSSGLVLGLCDLAASVYQNQDCNYAGHMSNAQLTQNVSALSLKCLVVEKTKLVTTNAFDKLLNFETLQEINLCLSLYTNSLKTVWTPLSDIYYYPCSNNNELKENILSNNNFSYIDEKNYLYEKWPNYFKNDIYYNSNFSLKFKNCMFTLTKNG